MFALKVIIASKSFIVRQGLLQTIHNVQTGILPVEVAAFDELITQIKTMIKGLILIDMDLFEDKHILPLNEAIQDLPGIHVLLIQRNNTTDISEKLDFQAIHLDIDQEQLEESIRGKHVLLVEDIVDTGRSMAYLKSVFKGRGPESLKICALIDKQERREVDLAVDHTGFNLTGKGFLVGYGMDYGERYRELDGIYQIVRPD